MKTVSKLDGDPLKLKEKWISDCTILLGAGKSHLSIINYIRAQGISADEAKRASYEIFDEAKKRFMKTQRIHIILGWSLIIMGVLCLLIIALNIGQFSGRIVMSGAPIMAGMFVLKKVRNPKSLPKDSSS